MKIRVMGVLTAFLLAALLLLGGCGKQPQQSASLTQDFSCMANVQYNGTEIVAKITRMNTGVCSIEVEQPANLKGFTMDWNGEKITLRYKGLSYSINPADLPETAFGSVLINTFNTAMQEEGMRIETEGDIIRLHGSSDSGDFTVEVDRKTGHLQSISVPSSGLTATFYDFQ